MSENTGKSKVINTGMLREDLEVIPPGAHGREWMIFDPVAGHYYKLTSLAYQVVRQLDRNYEFEEFLRRLENSGIEIDREELLEILQFLHGNCLMVPDYGTVAGKIAQYEEARRRNWLHRLAAAYLFFKLPPLRPDAFFSRTAPVVNAVFNRWTVCLILLVSLTGYLMLVRNWNLVYATFLDTLSWEGLVRYFWAILGVKVLHELSHGYVAKSFGCRVRGIGISFIVFYPRLFTDLTDSWRLPRSKRMAIDGAGIGAELLFGGLAGLGWLYSPPGNWHSTMFYLFAVSTFGTLLVNGNPFIRYDGYYLLCDLLNVDNLMQRSNDYVKAWNRFLVFGIPPRPKADGASPSLLFTFGVSAFIYRLFLYTSIILIVYFKFIKPLAIFLVIVECLAMIILPLVREFRIIAARRSKMSKRRFWVIGGAVLVVLGVLAIPFPWSYTLPAEVQPSGREMMAVKEPGFAVQSLPDEAFEVFSGKTILQMDNPFLDLNIRRYELIARQGEAEVELFRSDLQTISQTRQAYENWKAGQLTLAEMRRRRDGLTLKSTAPGLFVPLIKDVSPGRWLEKGTVLGEIISGDHKIFAYATDREVNKIFPGDSVQIILPGELDCVSGLVESVNPLPVSLKKSPLVQFFGGPIPCRLNPMNHEFIPVQVYYCITVKPEVPLERGNGRSGTVKISKSYMLGQVLYRNLLHAFQRELTF